MTPLAQLALLAVIDPITIGGFTVGTIALLALFSGGGKKKKAKKKTEPTDDSACPPLPPLRLDDVLSLVQQGTDEGIRGSMAFVSYIARMLYPTRDDGSPIAWPTKAPYALRAGIDASLVCRWDEIKRVVGELDPPVPEPENPKPADVIGDLISPYPLPGHFYQIKSGDSLDKIARQALNNLVPGAGDVFKTGRLAYILNCINVGAKWNLRLYGSTGTSNAFPSYYLTAGKGMRAAFFPYNAPAMSAILNSKYPQRTITASGGKVPGGSTWGFLWLPPVDQKVLTDFGEVVCAGTWSDGSSTTDPPPELLSLLGGP